MKPFLTPDEAQEIKRVFAIECERKLLRSVALNDALIPLTIAPPKPKYRVGQYVILPYLGAAYPVLAVDPFTCRYAVRNRWCYESDLRPLTAAEIEGPKEDDSEGR